MAGLDPAIFRRTVPTEMAGSGPAMTGSRGCGHSPLLPFAPPDPTARRSHRCQSVMAGLDPAIFRRTVPTEMAGSGPAMTGSRPLVHSSMPPPVPPGAATCQYEALRMAPLIEVTDLKKHFPIRKGILGRTVSNVLAVDGVSFSIDEGKTLGLVGESGCGKTTVGRTVLRLIEPTSGQIKVRGRDISGLDKAEMRPLRRQMQIVFQDPFSSLNPRIRVGKIVGEPLKVHGVGNKEERRARVAQLFQRVGLRPGTNRQLPAPVLRRPAAAGLHRAGAGARSRLHRRG